MEIKTEINQERNIRYNIVRGGLDVRDITEYLKKIYSVSVSYSNMNVFWDLQEADFTSLTSKDVKFIMEHVSAHWGKNGENKAALVVAGDYEFGMTRMFQLMLEVETTSKVAVFKDRGAAEKWIGAE